MQASSDTSVPIAPNPAAEAAPPAPAAGFAAGGRSATFTLVLAFLLYMLNYMDRNVMSAVAEYMKRDLALSDAQIGLLQTVFLVCVAGFALPAAFLVDRWSRRKGVALMALVWSGATALTGAVGGLGSLLGARALVGVGEAGYSSGGTAMLSAAYPQEKRAKVLGIFNASIPLGAALGTVLGALLAKKTDSWSTPFLVFAVPGFVLAGLTLLLRDYRTVQLDQPDFRRTLATLVRIPTLRFVYTGFAMNVFVSSAMLAWLPVYLARTYDLDLAAAGKKAALVLVLALVGSPLGGFLADRWERSNPRGRALACATTSALAAVTLAGALLVGGSVGFGLLIAWGVLTTAYLAPGGAITQDVVHPGLRATAWGTCVLSMYLLGGAYSPLVVGKLSDVSGSIGTALLVAPAAGLVASVLFLAAARVYPGDRAKVGSVELVREN